MKERRKLAKGATKEGYEERDKGGSSRQNFIDWKKVAEEAPKFYAPAEGSHKINIIPFVIKSKLHPSVKKGVAKVGDLHYMLDVFVHRFIGPNKADALCPKKNYGKPCPICDRVSELYDEGKNLEAKELQASRRVLLNVQVIGKRGPEEGLLVFNVSHYLFMKELLEEAHECGNGEDILEFADPEMGKVVSFRIEMEKLGKNDVPKFKSFKFIDREEELEDSLIDDALSFDAGLLLLEAPAIEALMFGADEEEEDDAEEDEPTPPKKKRAPVEEEEEEEEESTPPSRRRAAPKDEEDEPTPPKKKRPAPKDEEEEEVETPPSRKKKSVPVEEEEEEDEPTPPKKGAGKPKTQSCPSGHEWGEADQHKVCAKCPHWDDCMDASSK